MSRPETRAVELQEITGAIFGMVRIMEEDLGRDANEGEKAALGQFEQGAMLTAIRLLSNRANWLAEELEEEEQRITQGDDGEGKS